jgi:hypothetical protein
LIRAKLSIPFVTTYTLQEAQDDFDVIIRSFAQYSVERAQECCQPSEVNALASRCHEGDEMLFAGRSKAGCLAGGAFRLNVIVSKSIERGYQNQDYSSAIDMLFV